MCGGMCERILVAIGVICVVVFGLEGTHSQHDELRRTLHHYEVISLSDIKQHRVKRSASSDTKHVEFDALNKHFQLKLWTHRDILSSGFRVVSVNADNKETEVQLDRRRFYHGRLEDDTTSQVTAYEDDDGTLTATIQTKDEVYSIEPSWRHIPGTNKTSMIAYRNSDMDVPSDLGKSYCDFVRPEEQYPDLADQMKEEEAKERRKKRETATDDNQQGNTPKKSTCPLLLVADYRFFKEIGQSSQSSTASYLIGLADRVDNIYRKTVFGGDYQGMGFEIKEIRVHEAPTVIAGGFRRHYNEEVKGAWDTRELLEVFSMDAGFRGFCLAHLFTYQAFDGGVLGLAYIGSPRHYSVGGICSPVYHKGGLQLYLNTGWSSGLNKHNRRLLTQEADLVTTHEFGHNWGSEHDTDSEKCSPDSSKGGKYIMYTYSVSGYDANNKVFSPCSKASIKTVLAAKANNCFKEARGVYCGNSRVEKQQCDGDDCDATRDEQCDAGSHTPDGTDRCCDERCQLRDGAQCSDINDNCCDSECHFAESSQICHEAQDESCDRDSYCTGVSKSCPIPKVVDDGEDCSGRGKCLNGTCQPFCESIHLISCICDDEANACMFCCKDNDNSSCQAYRESPEADTYPLPEGNQCLLGSCNKEGKCEEEIRLVERLWDIIENITPSRLVAFMKANIVGTVIVLSLIIWIPASCVVSYVDRKRRLKDEKEVEWKAADNRAIVHPVDAPRISLRPVPVTGTMAYRRPPVYQPPVYQPAVVTEKGTFV